MKTNDPWSDRSTTAAVERMTDAAALDRARLLGTFGARGIREEMLLPAMVAATRGVTTPAVLIPEVPVQTVSGGDQPRRTPGRSDFVLLSGSASKTVMRVELKIAKYTGRHIAINREHLERTRAPGLATWIHQDGVRFIPGCLLVAALRVRKSISAGERWDDVDGRLPDLGVRPRVVARSRWVGGGCAVFAKALWYPAPSEGAAV